MSKKRFYFDTETSGLNPKDHGIIQIAGFIMIDGVREENFNIKMQLFPSDQISSEALKVNGRTIEEINGFQSPQCGYQELISILTRYVDKYNRHDKFYMLAYNAPFDDSMLRSWFVKNNDAFYGSFFYHPAICIMQQAAEKLEGKRHELPSFKLSAVAEYLGINLSDISLHEAMADIEIAYQIEQKLLTL